MIIQLYLETVKPHYYTFNRTEKIERYIRILDREVKTYINIKTYKETTI